MSNVATACCTHTLGLTVIGAVSQQIMNLLLTFFFCWQSCLHVVPVVIVIPAARFGRIGEGERGIHKIFL